MPPGEISYRECGGRTDSIWSRIRSTPDILKNPSKAFRKIGLEMFPRYDPTSQPDCSSKVISSDPENIIRMVLDESCISLTEID